MLQFDHKIVFSHYSSWIYRCTLMGNCQTECFISGLCYGDVLPENKINKAIRNYISFNYLHVL